MSRRDFLTSSLRGIVLGAAISSGLGRTSIAMYDRFIYRRWYALSPRFEITFEDTVIELEVSRNG